MNPQLLFVLGLLGVCAALFVVGEGLVRTGIANRIGVALARIPDSQGLGGSTETSAARWAV